MESAPHSYPVVINNITDVTNARQVVFVNMNDIVPQSHLIIDDIYVDEVDISDTMSPTSDNIVTIEYDIHLLEVDKVNPNTDNSKLYITNFNSGMQYKCKFCIYATNNIRHINCHLRVYHSEINSSNNININRINLDNIIANNSEISNTRSNYKCKHCNFESNNMSDIVAHMGETHKEMKLFSCNQCNYSTNYRYSIKKHLDMHENVTKYCCKKCNLYYKNRNGLRRHINKHMNISKPIDVKEHMKNGEYICESCDYVTVGIKNLNKHIEEKHSFKCYLCQYITTKGLNMRTHLSEYHPDVYTSTSTPKFH